MLAEEYYLILGEAGRGGMSVVYKVQDRRDHRIYAMKTIREREDAERKQMQQTRLAAEAELMRGLDHPAIPGIHEILEDQGQIYLVMEYVDGISLAELLQERGRQEETVVIEWAKQLCRVLSYLHEWDPPVIYRDLKPANLLLTEDNRIHLIDFGAAGTMAEKVLQRGEVSGGKFQGGSEKSDKVRQCRQIRVWGTRGYAPPEQYTGYTGPCSDIYGLGITICQLVTGRDPSGGKKGFDELSGFRQKYLCRKRLPESALDGIRLRMRYFHRNFLYRRYGVSAELQGILRRCTARSAADRYPDCRLVYQDLCEISEKKKAKKRNRIGSLMWVISISGVIWGFRQIWILINGF